MHFYITKEKLMANRFFQDINKYFHFSIVSAKSQLKAEVAGSYLTWIWWILDPLCFMLIYTFIFGYVFDSQELYFPVYIFIGLSMWNFFNKTLQSSVKIIKNNKSIVSKVYFPKYILLLIRIWINAFKMLVAFALVVVMMIVFQIPVTWNVLYAIPIIFILGLFTFGCGCFLMHYGVYINDLSNIIAILLRLLFYMTGIFYNIEKRIPQYGTALNQYNPVAFLLSSMRQCLIYGQAPNRILLLFWMTVSIILVVLGVRKIYKEENSYVKAI